MTRGFTNVRVGLAGAHRTSRHTKRAPDSSCATGGFYKNPTHGQSIDSSHPVNISWDTTCLNTEAVDIYLFAPGANQSRIHLWQTVKYSSGSYMTTFEPKWWNATATMTLQLSIVATGTQPFLSPLPAGPVFNATYNAPSSGATPAVADVAQPDAGVTIVNNLSDKHGLSSGKIAAAVIIPLLVIGLVVAAYLRMVRMKGKEKRKRWSQAVDKRMSTISTDWKAMSPAGATAAIRNSMAGSRNSAFSFGAIRPASTITVEHGGQAGIGARGASEDTTFDPRGPPQMSQLRPGVRSSAFGERVSRVSFAPDTRPSVESRRTVTSRAFHNGFVPLMPEHQDSGEMSPTQTQGPIPLTPEDIRSRISQEGRRPSVEDAHPVSEDEYQIPVPPTPALSPPHTSTAVVMQPASVMSPDEMLREYARRKTSMSGPSPGGIAYPAPTANYNGNGMRTLYSPTSPATPDTGAPMMGHHSHHSDDNDDAYGGTVN